MESSFSIQLQTTSFTSVNLILFHYFSCSKIYTAKILFSPWNQKMDGNWSYPVLDGFIISGNPLQCDCNLFLLGEWIRQWIRHKTASGSTIDQNKYSALCQNGIGKSVSILKLPNNCHEKAQTSSSSGPKLLTFIVVFSIYLIYSWTFGLLINAFIFLKIIFCPNPRQASSRIFLISLVYVCMYFFIYVFVSRLLPKLKTIQT